MTAAAERYAIPALTATADAEALAAWFDAAAPGDRALIAEGRVKPVAALAWVLAEQWRRTGAAAIHSERAGAATRWIVERLGDPAMASAARSPVERREPEAPDGTPVSDHILRTIKRHANMRLGAPSLAMLAKGAGLKTAAGARYYVEKLKMRGLIAIETQVVIGGERRRYHLIDREGRRIKSTDWARGAGSGPLPGVRS